MMRILVILVASASWAMAAGDAQAGKAVFEKSCQVCHGPSGQGNPGMAKMLNVAIPALSSSEVQSKSDGDLKKIVLEGSGKMKPVKLTDGQVADVIAYLRGLPKNR